MCNFLKRVKVGDRVKKQKLMCNKLLVEHPFKLFYEENYNKTVILFSRRSIIR